MQALAISAGQQRRKARSGKAAIVIHVPANVREMPADAPADAGEPCEGPLRMPKTRNMAADTFPAFEKYKVIEEAALRMPNRMAHCMGGDRVFYRFLPFNDAFVLRSSLLPTWVVSAKPVPATC